jgi:hypothetical protein
LEYKFLYRRIETYNTAQIVKFEEKLRGEHFAIILWKVGEGPRNPVFTYCLICLNFCNEKDWAKDLKWKKRMKEDNKKRNRAQRVQVKLIL